MTEQNSVVEQQIRPEALMDEIGIKKDAYYAYLKHLGIKAEKDQEGKAYLTEAQANAVRALRSHVEQTGKMEGFVNSISNSNSELAIVSESSLLDQAAQTTTDPQGERLDDQFDDLIRAAAELKGQQLVLPQLVIRELANRMTYDDLPADVKAKVNSVREAASPKFQPAHLADSLLAQWRSQNQAAA